MGYAHGREQLRKPFPTSTYNNAANISHHRKSKKNRVEKAQAYTARDFETDFSGQARSPESPSRSRSKKRRSRKRRRSRSRSTPRRRSRSRSTPRRGLSSTDLQLFMLTHSSLLTEIA